METATTFISVKEFAELASIHLMTAYDWVHIKGFPSSKIGKKILINKDKAIKWIEKRTVA